MKSIDDESANDVSFLRQELARVKVEFEKTLNEKEREIASLRSRIEAEMKVYAESELGQLPNAIDGSENSI